MEPGLTSGSESSGTSWSNPFQTEFGPLTQSPVQGSAPSFQLAAGTFSFTPASFTTPGTLFDQPGEQEEGEYEWNGGDFENPYWEGFKGFLHGYFITGPKAVVNSTADTTVSFATLGTVDAPDLIPVDPLTDLGYDSSRIFADIATNVALTAATANLSCATKIGQVAQAMDVGGGVVGAGHALENMAENGVGFGNGAQLVTNLVTVSVGMRYPECFPAGTPVSTEQGLRPIEEIRAGDRVWSYSLTQGEWVLRPVLETYEFFSGDFVELGIDGPSGEEDKITSTAHHPYWVIRGEDLENRPRPEHITAAEEELLGERAKIPGRWVDAAEIYPNDVLLLQDGREAEVWNVELFHEPQKTYNFAVDDLHCYAVGELCVLVHNNCGSVELAANLKAAGHQRPANSAAHHIVAMGDNRAQIARNILAREGIDINDAANGVFLPRGSRFAAAGQISHSRLHTNRYYANVNAILQKAPSGTVADVLNDIRTQLLNGTFSY